MAQIWHDLLFAHWPIPVEQLRRLVPSLLPLDEFDGRAWVGLVPFRMSGIRGRLLPPIPGLSSFPEFNVRTYVTLDGKPGVYFFSLDAASLAAVWGARASYRLPYFHARMSCEKPSAGSEEICYRSERLHGPRPAVFRGRYWPVGLMELRRAGTLEHWLSERYCLYTVAGEKVYRGEIHHESWPLQNAEAEIEENSMTAAAGIDLPPRPPLLHFARKLRVLIWPIRRIR